MPNTPHPHARLSEYPSISVIVPVRNEARHISNTLEQLLAQDRKGLDIEILVVDGRSTDRTREIVKILAARHPEIRLLDNPHHLSSAARNVGIRNSRGEYVVIIDGHCEIPTRSYFQNLVRAFEQSGADCLGRPQPLDVTHDTPLQRAIALARASRLGHHPDSCIYSNQEVDCPAASIAIAYRRSVYDRVGLFDEHFDACEDYELNHRIDQAGLSCRLVPKLTVNYQPRASLIGLFWQLVRYGRGRVRFSRKHSGTWGLGVLIPALFVLYVLLGGILALAVPSITIPYAAGLVVYVAVVVAFSIGIAIQERKLSLLFWLPLVFLAIHTGAGVGILTEAIAPKNIADSYRVPSLK